jgi:DNA segregation ATPase FtsK/SpoIIIE, S-DNA-T family
MRIALTAFTPQGPRDLIISGDDGSTVGQVAAELHSSFWPRERLAAVIQLPGGGGAARGQRLAPAQRGTLWVNARPLDPSAIAAAVLHDGAVVAADQQDAAATVLEEPTGVVEIRAVGGPSAGSVHRLGFGAATLGASRDCHVPVMGAGLPSCAARITVSASGPVPGVLLEPQHSGPAGPPQHSGPAGLPPAAHGEIGGEAGPEPVTAALLLDGEPVTGPRPWLPGALLEIGPHVLALAVPEQPDAHLSPADDGGLAYNRPPRLLPPGQRRRIAVPAEPKRGEKARLQLFAALIPLALGLVMVKVLHSAIYALFMLMSPVMIGGQWMSDRRRGRVSHKRAMREYQRKMGDLESVIGAERAADEAERRDAAPDPAQVLLTATGPRRRLWERRAADPDALHLRIGLTSLPAQVELVPEKGAPRDAEMPPPPVARSVPATLPLPRLGVIGLAGPADASRGLARWLVAQAAALHSPRDLQIVVLAADPAAGQHWNWVRWLPHCAPRKGETCFALVGSDPASAGMRVAELASEVSERLGRASSLAAGGSRDDEQSASPDLGPRILVVLDGARALRRIPGMPQVLAAARRAGVYSICIDESERLLPEECAAVASWEAAQPAFVTLRGSGSEALGLVLADQVSPAWADRMARALAPVRDVSRDDPDAAIPAAARLLELIGMPDPDPGVIAAGWDRGGAATAVPIGIGADGPYTVDLRADGPHGLIAGTTGAGKSELLQTIIASLAVANRPDSMTFVLIDYKGGSAFKDCARLPHTVGMVSDLDGHLTQRALASLSAELKRREEVLLHAGAKDIEDYWDTIRSRPELAPLPRLVLIIDEFASLVTELPDFVTGLVGIAQRGRSLGVHLILATQRPAGVVSADIRANTNLRIALRVTDAEESSDVIDAPDAAFIARSTPGRCYIRSGAAAPVAVQSARIGGRRPGAGPAQASARAIPVPWAGLGRPVPVLARGAGDDDGTMITDLSVLVDSIAGAASKLSVPEQTSPWLPPLAGIVTLDQISVAAAGPPGEVPAIPYGLTDVPAAQAREPLTLDLAHGGHVVIAGAARSGRSTALRTIAGSVTAHVSPADVHIYAIDCGTGAMLPLAGLPHCGAVVSRDQTDRLERLIGKLRGEITRRQQLLAAGGFAGLAEQRAHEPGAALPWMLLLVDWWEGLVAAYEQYDYGRLIDALLQVFREGAAVGLRAVVTTDRAALLGQAGTVFGQRMLLRLTDRGDSSLAGISERSMPSHQPPGRIMFEATPDPLEAQIAMLDGDPSGPAQVAALRRLASQSQQRCGALARAQRPLRVDALPARITAAQTWQLDPGFAPPSPLWALVGAGGDELRPQGLDVRDEGPGLVLAGPPRSGRSSTLMTMARTLLANGTPVLVITPRRSPLRSLEGAAGVLAVLGSDGTADALTAATQDLERYVVLADDAELLINGALSGPLEKLLLSGRDADHGLILAGSTGDLARAYSGFIPAALKSRCGVFVAVDSPGDGDLFGVRLPRNAGSSSLGRGLLVRPGTVMPVQLALSEEPPPGD